MNRGRRGGIAAWTVVVACAGLIAVLAVSELKRDPMGSTDKGATPERTKLLRRVATLYRREAELRVELSEPRGLAISASGGLYVCGDRHVLKVGETGETLRRYLLENPPRTLDLLPDERIIIGFDGHLEVLDQLTGISESWSDLGDQAILTSVRVAVSGEEVYVADAGNRQVLIFDRGGKLLGTVGAPDSRGATSFLIPSPYFDIAPNPAVPGELWIADPGRHLLKRFTREGTLLFSWGSYAADIAGFAGCCNPSHMAILPNGDIVTSEKGIPRVKLYDQKGALKGVVAGPAAFPRDSEGLDLAVSPSGDIMVLAPKARVIQIYRRVEESS